jgi:hypothetical protein
MTIFKPELEMAENTGGVIPSHIYNYYATKGSELEDDLIVLGSVSYGAKIKSLRLSTDLVSTTLAPQKADLVLLDGENGVSTTLKSDIILSSLDRAEQMTVAQNNVPLRDLTEDRGYQNNYRLALRLSTDLTAADKCIYSETSVIDNV